jgi:hypothetical protein
MERRAVRDLQKAPQITDTIIEYLLQLENADKYLDPMMKLWNRNEGDTARLIHISRFLCDASLSPKTSKRIANFAVGWATSEDDRPGAGYARALLLLVVHKHGQRTHRNKLAQWASLDTLKDEQLRLHFLYVFICREELVETLRLALMPFISSDAELLVRLCAQAQSGNVRKAKKMLNRYVRSRGNHRSVEARVLPLLSALVLSSNAGVQEWIEGILEPTSKEVRPLCDRVLRSILETLNDGELSETLSAAEFCAVEEKELL